MPSSFVNAFTPSALSTILLCAAHSKGDRDYATIYAVLRRHLSNSSVDRHFCVNHTYDFESGRSELDVRQVFLCHRELEGLMNADVVPWTGSGIHDPLFQRHR